MSTGSNVATAEKTQKVGVRTLVQIGMLAAIAVVLMLFEIPLPFAPSFYKIDFSEVPVMVGCFVMGPLAGAAIEFVKILLNFVINGTTTAGVGEVANFLVGCALCVPAGVIYKYKRTRKGALLGMIGYCRKCNECICITSSLCKSIWNANRRIGSNGNCS